MISPEFSSRASSLGTLEGITCPRTCRYDDDTSATLRDCSAIIAAFPPYLISYAGPSADWGSSRFSDAGDQRSGFGQSWTPQATVPELVPFLDPIPSIVEESGPKSAAIDSQQPSTQTATAFAALAPLPQPPLQSPPPNPVPIPKSSSSRHPTPQPRPPRVAEPSAQVRHRDSPSRTSFPASAACIWLYPSVKVSFGALYARVLSPMLPKSDSRVVLSRILVSSAAQGVLPSYLIGIISFS